MISITTALGYQEGGGKEFLYFGDEVREALESYLKERKPDKTLRAGDSLFLSLQRRRSAIVPFKSSKNMQNHWSIKNILINYRTYGTTLS